MGAAKIRRLAEARGEVEHQAGRYERTFNAMKPWLPAAVNDFLDIGCGTGGIAMHVARHYRTATAHLMDGAADGVPGAWRTDGVPWRDISAALRGFAKHCPGVRVRGWPPDPGLTIRCELIYSTCSWGHHYPIETYLDLVDRSLAPGGTLIVDLRIGEHADHGESVLSRVFERRGTICAPGKKYLRTVWGR